MRNGDSSHIGSNLIDFTEYRLKYKLKEKGFKYLQNINGQFRSWMRINKKAVHTSTEDTSNLIFLFEQKNSKDQ